MAGLIGTGQSYKNQGLSGLIRQAAQEELISRENARIESERKQQQYNAIGQLAGLAGALYLRGGGKKVLDPTMRSLMETPHPAGTIGPLGQDLMFSETMITGPEQIIGTNLLPVAEAVTAATLAPEAATAVGGLGGAIGMGDAAAFAAGELAMEAAIPDLALATIGLFAL
jgi:hypothetical protein